MDRIKNLISSLCPDGVPFKKLGEIGSFYGGLTGKSKEDFSDGNAVFISYMNVFSNIELRTDIDDRVRVGENEKQNTIRYGDILFTGSSETPDECGMSSVLTTHTDKKLYLNSFCFGYRFDDPNLFLPSFTKHLFRSGDLRRQIIKTASGVTRFNVSKKKMEDVIIPVPPLKVQEEIVQILDEFTNLTSKLTSALTSELAARKKQYDYYATKLFTESGAENVELSEIASFVYGYTDKAQDNGDARFIRITDINDQGYLKGEEKKYITLNADAQKYLLKKGDIIMARTGATYGKTLYFDNDYPSVYASFLIKIIPNERLLTKYYWHYTKTSMYWNQANKLVTSGGQPQFNTPAVKRIRVPLPSIDVQQYIVDVLDNLDKLNNSLSDNIPAEIQLRQKQYEHYRDGLLSFEERSV